jgi:hypothetical protein
MTRWSAATAALLATTVWSGGALADTIDGLWCFKTRTMSIDGPTIITPGGHQITGDYERHAFFYTVPANEPGAGAAVRMQLVNEETVNLWIEPGPAEAEVWLRCKPIA